MNPYQQRLARVQSAMRDWGADLLFLNYGPDFTYIGGILAPMYYTILMAEGDWIIGILVPREGEPVLLLHPYLTVNIKEQTLIGDTRVLPDGQIPPDLWLALKLAEFHPAGKTIAIGRMLWGQSLLSLQAATPCALYMPAANAMTDRLRAVKDAGELALMQRAAEITAENSTPATRGQVLGAYGTAGSLGSALSPLLLGFVAEVWGAVAVFVATAAT